MHFVSYSCIHSFAALIHSASVLVLQGIVRPPQQALQVDRYVNWYLQCSVMSIATVLISVYSMRKKRLRTTSGQGLIRKAILGNDVNLTEERSEPRVVQGTCLKEGETAWKWGRGVGWEETSKRMGFLSIRG